MMGLFIFLKDECHGFNHFFGLLVHEVFFGGSPFPQFYWGTQGKP
jgi:hypothetical protein